MWNLQQASAKGGFDLMIADMQKEAFPKWQQEAQQEGDCFCLNFKGWFFHVLFSDIKILCIALSWQLPKEFREMLIAYHSEKDI